MDTGSCMSKVNASHSNGHPDVVPSCDVPTFLESESARNAKHVVFETEDLFLEILSYMAYAPGEAVLHSTDALAAKDEAERLVCLYNFESSRLFDMSGCGKDPKAVLRWKKRWKRKKHQATSCTREKDGDDEAETQSSCSSSSSTNPMSLFYKVTRNVHRRLRHTCSKAEEDLDESSTHRDATYVHTFGTLTHVLPLVCRRWRDVCCHSDFLWKTAMLRLITLSSSATPSITARSTRTSQTPTRQSPWVIGLQSYLALQHAKHQEAHTNHHTKNKPSNFTFHHLKLGCGDSWRWYYDVRSLRQDPQALFHGHVGSTSTMAGVVRRRTDASFSSSSRLANPWPERQSPSSSELSIHQGEEEHSQAQAYNQGLLQLLNQAVAHCQSTHLQPYSRSSSSTTLPDISPPPPLESALPTTCATTTTSCCPTKHLFTSIYSTYIQSTLVPIFAMKCARPPRLGEVLHLHLFEPRYRLMIAEIMKERSASERRGMPLQRRQQGCVNVRRGGGGGAGSSSNDDGNERVCVQEWSSGQKSFPRFAFAYGGECARYGATTTTREYAEYAEESSEEEEYAASLQDEYPSSHYNSNPDPHTPTPSPPHGSNPPPWEEEKVAMVEVRRCVIHPANGKAGVAIVPVAFGRLEGVTVLPHSGQLRYGKFVKSLVQPRWR